SAPTSKQNPPELPLGGDRLPDIVRPRTRCERDELHARGAKRNAAPRSCSRAWGRCRPLAAGLSRLRPLGFAPRRHRRFALEQRDAAAISSKNDADSVLGVTKRVSVVPLSIRV